MKNTNHNPNPWVVVINPGTDEEDIWGDYPSFREAVAAQAEINDEADVMKLRNDGTLSTEF